VASLLFFISTLFFSFRTELKIQGDNEIEEIVFNGAGIED
jgi:hypothetical protein